MWPFGRCAGKLNGPSTASTPRGWKVARAPGAAFDRAHELHAGAERGVDLRREQARLGARVPERLADLARDELRQLFGALVRERGEAAQHGGARLEARVAPRREGLARARRPPRRARRLPHGEAADLVASDRRARRCEMTSTTRPHGSGVTLTRSPLCDASASRHSAETTGAPSASSGTTVARKRAADLGGEQRERALVAELGRRGLAGQHQLAALAHRDDRVARRAVVRAAVEGIDLVQRREADLLEDAHAPPSRSRSARRSPSAPPPGRASRRPDPPGTGRR